MLRYIISKNLKFLSSDMSKNVCISFLYNINNIIPKIDPCGTPIFIFNFEKLISPSLVI